KARFRVSRPSSIAFALIVAATTATLAQQPPPPAGGPPQENWKPEKLTNLKVLPKDTTPDQIMETMRHYTRSLGVGCLGCHKGHEGQPAVDFGLRRRFEGEQRNHPRNDQDDAGHQHEIPSRVPRKKRRRQRQAARHLRHLPSPQPPSRNRTTTATTT